MVASYRNNPVNKGDDPPSAAIPEVNEAIKDRKKINKANIKAKESPNTNNGTTCPGTSSRLDSFEKPMKTLENSLIKLQETTNDQQLQLNLLDENKSQCNSVHPEVKQELFDLRTKIDSLLKSIEIPQNTLSELMAKNGVAQEMNSSLDLSSRVICNDKGMQTEPLSQNSNSSYSSGTLDEGTSLV